MMGNGAARNQRHLASNLSSNLRVPLTQLACLLNFTWGALVSSWGNQNGIQTSTGFHCWVDWKRQQKYQAQSLAPKRDLDAYLPRMPYRNTTN